MMTTVCGSACDVRTDSTNGYQSLRLKTLGDWYDWRIEVHCELWDWLERETLRFRRPKREKVFGEFAIAWAHYLQDGQFSWSTRMLKGVWGGRFRQSMKVLMDDCPHTQQARGHIVGIRSRDYTFVNLPGVSKRLEAPNEAQHYGLPTSSHSVPRLSMSPSMTKPFLINGSWYVGRCDRWSQWCERSGLSNRLDYFGDTKLGAFLQKDVFPHIELPTRKAFLSEVAAEKREWHDRYHDRLLGSGVPFLLKSLDGRHYHPLSACPRALRSRLLFAGEPVGEVDLNASFYVLIAAQLKDDREKSKLVEWTRSGRFYERLANETAAYRYGAGKALLKAHCQTQILFGKDRRLESRPLWLTFRRLFPNTASMIQGWRGRMTESDLAKHLMRLEGELMSPIHQRLMEKSIVFLPNHDGIVTQVKQLDQVRDIFLECGFDVLGFEPRVGTKHFNWD